MEFDKPLVVGFDSSPDAARALEWAVRLATVTDSPVRVLIARGDLYTVSSWADEWTRSLAEEWAAQARKQLSELQADAEVVIADGQPSQVLVAASTDSSLVVVGSRGHGAVMGVLQGSVSQHVARHASSRVAVVRPAQDDASRRIVVGVDGSAASLEALETAVHLAGLHGYRLDIVHATERPPFELTEPLLLESWDAEDAQVLESAAAVMARHEGVGFEARIVRDRPIRTLIDASHHAAMVVVGSRGRGAFAGLLLGSVSAGLLQHAHCPVVVTR